MVLVDRAEEAAGSAAVAVAIDFYLQGLKPRCFCEPDDAVESARPLKTKKPLLLRETCDGTTPNYIIRQN